MYKSSGLISNPFSVLDITFLSLVLLLSFVGIANSVPAVPNEAVLRGTVTEYCLTSSALLSVSPPQVLYKLVVSVEQVEAVEGHPNFLKGKEGQSVTIYSKEKQPPEFFGKKVRVFVKYMGDERGGLFWINRIEVMK